MKIAIVPQPGVIKLSASGYRKRMYHLADELDKMGHKVRIFGLPGSRTRGELVTSLNFGRKPYTFSWETRINFMAQAILASQDCDIINCQTDHVATVLDRFSKVPILHTIITSNLLGPSRKLLRLNKDLKYSAVSGAPKNRFKYLKFQGVIYNGCDTKNFKFNPKPKDYFLTMSRIHPDKGVHRAVAAARAAKIKLRIAGRIDDEPYFNKTIKPYLGKNIKYLGFIEPSGFRGKVKLIQNAKCVFALSKQDEGFSNTILESLSCGTPVIAWDQYSYKEIIKNNKTGFIVSDKQSLKRAIKSIDKIDRAYCHQVIEDNYTYARMARGYEKLFKRIAKK